jgi:hypothetical protein
MHSPTGVPFESAAQRDAHERLRAPLEAQFPGHVNERIHAIGYVLRFDGATVTCTLAPWGEDDATIAVRSYLAGAVPMGEEVLRELARWTSDARFGTFGVDPADNVYFEQHLVASTTPPEMVARAVHDVMALVAARTGEFRARFGGTDL